MTDSPLTTGRIAAVLHARVVGSSDLPITGVAALDEAGESDLSFVAAHVTVTAARSSRAGALLVNRPLDELSCAQFIVPHPALAMAQVVEALFLNQRPAFGISNLASRGQHVTLGREVSIWPFVTLDDHVSIGRGTTLFPGVFVGAGSTIGEDCLIYPNVTVREGITIGNRVIIHAGTVIGSDGFGYLQEAGRHRKIPQVGTVIIEDDVELGANVAVDRATFGKTVIRRGTKIDNLVQIAHNVEIGEDNILVSQVGIAGSSKTGHHVMVGGQAGIADHVSVGDLAMVAARAGLNRDVAAKEIVSGAPALPHRTWLKAMAVVAKLPELREQVRALELRMTTLERKPTSSTRSAKTDPRHAERASRARLSSKPSPRVRAKRTPKRRR